MAIASGLRVAQVWRRAAMDGALMVEGMARHPQVRPWCLLVGILCPGPGPSPNPKRPGRTECAVKILRSGLHARGDGPRSPARAAGRDHVAPEHLDGLHRALVRDRLRLRDQHDLV